MNGKYCVYEQYMGKKLNIVKNFLWIGIQKSAYLAMPGGVTTGVSDDGYHAKRRLQDAASLL